MLNMSSSVAEPDFLFSPLELYNPKWSVIAWFTFFSHYSLMSCTCDFKTENSKLWVTESSTIFQPISLFLLIRRQLGIQEVYLEGLYNSWPKLRNCTLTETSSSFIYISMLKIYWTNEDSFFGIPVETNFSPYQVMRVLYPSTQRHYRRLILLLILLHVSVIQPSSIRKYTIVTLRRQI
jgi:hypothetical protein